MILSQLRPKVQGAVKYCTFLVEIEDRVDDETLESLRLQEEVQAAAGELPEDFQGFSLHMAESLGLEDAPGPKLDDAKTKLESFPAIELNRLPERVKKYKDHALARKSKFNSTADRLREEGSKGHENLCRQWTIRQFSCRWHLLQDLCILFILEASPEERSR